MDELEFIIEMLEIDLEANDRSRAIKAERARSDSRKIKIRSFHTGDNIDHVLKTHMTPRQYRRYIRHMDKNKFQKNTKATDDHLGLYNDECNTVFINKDGIKRRRANAGPHQTFTPKGVLRHELRHAKQHILARTLGGIQNSRRMGAKSGRQPDYHNRPLEYDAYSVEGGKDKPSMLNNVVRSTIGYKKPAKRVKKMKFHDGDEVASAAHRSGYRHYGPPEDFSSAGW